MILDSDSIEQLEVRLTDLKKQKAHHDDQRAHHDKQRRILQKEMQDITQRILLHYQRAASKPKK